MSHISAGVIIALFKLVYSLGTVSELGDVAHGLRFTTKIFNKLSMKVMFGDGNICDNLKVFLFKL